MSEAIHLARHESKEPQRCPYCHGDLAGVGVWKCPGCGTAHHAECVRDNGSCTVLGCRRTFDGKVAVTPHRPMPVRTPPRADFRIGLRLAGIGGLGLAVIATIHQSHPLDSSIVFDVLALPTLLFAGGLLTMGYALERRWRTGRWAR